MTMLNAPPDGYTLQMVSSAHTVNPTLFSKLPYDTLKDVSGVALVASSPTVAVVNPKLGVKTLPEFIKLAKSRPGSMNYGSAGLGSSTHLVAEYLRKEAGIQMTHVPYKGMNPAVTDIIGGHVDVLIASAPSIYQHVKAGKIRGIGVTSKGPSTVVPDLQPIASMGVPNYSFELWWGVLAPPGTPAQIVERVNADMNRILATPEMKEVFLREGAEPAVMTPAQFAKTIREEIEGWKRVAKRANIKAE